MGAVFILHVAVHDKQHATHREWDKCKTLKVFVRLLQFSFSKSDEFVHRFFNHSLLCMLSVNLTRSYLKFIIYIHNLCIWPNTNASICLFLSLERRNRTNDKNIILCPSCLRVCNISNSLIISLAKYQIIFCWCFECLAISEEAAIVKKKLSVLVYFFIFQKKYFF